jgi:hypothetical protein
MSLEFDIFVQAKKAALGVYQRANFVLVDGIIQDDTVFGGKGEYSAYFLVREKKKTKDS